MRNLVTRSQSYAKRVFTQVNRHKQDLEEILNQQSMDEDTRKKADILRALIRRYGSLCHRFPVLVLRNGLAQAVGFLQAKVRDDRTTADSWFLTDLAELLLGIQSGDELQQRVHSADLSEYRRLTREALAAAIWYKRFAQSVLGVDPAEAGESL